MFWGSSLRFSHLTNHSWVKCYNWPIVVGNDSMDLQLDKSNIDNEEKFVMLWRRSLRFPHPTNHSLVKCYNWSIVVGNDSMHLQVDKSNIDNEERLPMLWRNSLRFSQFISCNWAKCCNWPSLLVMIQWTYKKISPTLIMKRGFQCLEEFV